MGSGASLLRIDQSDGFPLIVREPEVYTSKYLVLSGGDGHLTVGEEEDSIHFIVQGDVGSYFQLKDKAGRILRHSKDGTLAFDKESASFFFFRDGYLCMKSKRIKDPDLRKQLKEVETRLCDLKKQAIAEDNDDQLLKVLCDLRDVRTRLREDAEEDEMSTEDLVAGLFSEGGSPVRVKLVPRDDSGAIKFRTKVSMEFPDSSSKSKENIDGSRLISLDEAKTMVLKKELEFDDFFSDFFDDTKDAYGWLKVTSVEKRIRRAIANRREREKRKEEKHHERAKSGKALLKLLMELPLVNGLRSVPSFWRNALLPKDSDDGKKILQIMNDIDQRCKRELGISPGSDYDPSRDDISGSLLRHFVEVASKKAPAFFNERIELYDQVLNSKEPKMQNAVVEICSLLNALENTYRDCYDSAFRTVIKLRDREMLNTWTKFVRSSDVAKFCGVQISQSVDEIPMCMVEGIKIMGEYRRLFERIARATGGKFNFAPSKRSFRVMEKCAMTPVDKKRFRCNNVYDIIRGALVYSNMKGIWLALHFIITCKEFKILRVKDRFTPGRETSGGWRDCIINGYLVSDSQRHVLEVQLHHESLLLIREDLGGHYIYAIYRALNEALEVHSIDRSRVGAKLGANGDESKSLFNIVSTVKKSSDDLSAVPNASTSWIGSLIAIEEPQFLTKEELFLKGSDVCPGFEVRGIQAVGKTSAYQLMCEDTYLATNERYGGKTLYCGMRNRFFFYWSELYHNWVCTLSRANFGRGSGYLRTEKKGQRYPSGRLQLHNSSKWVFSGATITAYLSADDVANLCMKHKESIVEDKRANLAVELSGIVGNASQNKCNGRFYASKESWVDAGRRYALYIKETGTHFLYYSNKYRNYVIINRADMMEKGSGYVRTKNLNLHMPMGELEFYDYGAKAWTLVPEGKVSTIPAVEAEKVIAKRAAIMSDVKKIVTVQVHGFSPLYDGRYTQDADLTLGGRPTYVKDKDDGATYLFYTQIYENWILTKSRADCLKGSGNFRTKGKSHSLEPPLSVDGEDPPSIEWETFNFTSKTWVEHHGGKIFPVNSETKDCAK